ncbi:MAG: hypothetical protein IV090_11040 [Candidatus Sericytochromatia bacterium]|nr:hypothetical protein [Candidatus Sericytochromatia bacterium]
MFRRETRSLALWLNPREAVLVEREHGLVAQEAACLIRPLVGDKAQLWGNSALLSGRSTPLWQNGWRAQELKAYVQALLSRVIAPNRCQLVLPMLNLREPYCRAFWDLLGLHLQLDSLYLCSPLTCLAQLPDVKQTDLHLFLEDGLAECCLGSPQGFPLTVGYGRYLSRALQQYVYQRYQLQIEEDAAALAWQRLGGLSGVQEQITLQGQDGEGKSPYLLLIAEELAPLAEAAFQPLVQLCQTQLELQSAGARGKVSGLRLSGEQAVLPGLADYLQNRLQIAVTLTPAGPDIMIKALQIFLQSRQG